MCLRGACLLQVIGSGPSWAVDAWGLGCTIQEVFSGGMSLARTEDLRNTASIPKELLGDYQKLLASMPSRRLDPARLLSGCPYLQGKVTVEVVSFLEGMALKDSAEREVAFRRMAQQVAGVPLPVATSKVLPMVASALELGVAPANALNTLLAIGGRMAVEDRERRLVPSLIKLYGSQDRSLRRALLERLEDYAGGLSPQVLEEQVYPQLAGGFTDQAPYLRELTLKSMLRLAPRLSQKTINNSLLKHLAKLQVDEEPAIRANTNILLGHLAPYMGEAACKRVLLNAFLRAVKDSFPPSRAAALKALAATQAYYSAEELATRLVPAVAPLAVDPDADTRSAALHCLQTSVQSLASPPIPTAGPAPAAAPAPAASSGLLSWAGWSPASASAASPPRPAVAPVRPSVDRAVVEPKAPAIAGEPSTRAAEDIGERVLPTIRIVFMCIDCIPPNLWLQARAGTTTKTSLPRSTPRRRRLGANCAGARLQGAQGGLSHRLVPLVEQLVGLLPRDISRRTLPKSGLRRRLLLRWRALQFLRRPCRQLTTFLPLWTSRRQSRLASPWDSAQESCNPIRGVQGHHEIWLLIALMGDSFSPYFIHFLSRSPLLLQVDR